MNDGDAGVTALLQDAADEVERRVRPVELDAVLVEGTRRSRRRTWRRRASAVAVLAGVTVVFLVIPRPDVVPHQRSTPPSLSRSKQPSKPTGPTVAELLAGRWSLIPSAPITPRGDAVEVWTGKELIVWGGEAGAHGATLFGDGAAYDPVTNRWRLLPASPLTARSGASAVWTGTQVIVFGGYVNLALGAFRVSSQAAAYDPATNRWTLLPPAPISARADALMSWTGRDVVVLGGRPAVTTGVLPGYDDGAVLDPVADTWKPISAPTPPKGHGIDWVAAVRRGDEVMGFSTWSETRSLGKGTVSMSGGVDVFTYDDASGAWRRVPQQAGAAIPSPGEVLAAGKYVIVRGGSYTCGACVGPFMPEITDFYTPSDGSWYQIAPDPLGGDHEISAWTGNALFSFDGGCQCGNHLPGAASLYDPVQARWQLLRSAPFGCGGEPLVWTGRQLVVYCPNGGSRPPAGLAYTPGRATPGGGPIKIGLILSRTTVAAGAPIRAVVTVTNTTKATITFDGVCPDINQSLAVGLTNARVLFVPAVATPACAHGPPLHPGTSRFPITIATTYNECTQSKAQATPQMPPCASTGMPPLPPGTYVTKVVGVGLPSGTVLPAPITVIVTSART